MKRSPNLARHRHRSNIDKLQRHLLNKAAELGADAVVFSTPITRTEQRVAYQPVYSPWGYYAPLLWSGSLRLLGAVGLSLWTMGTDVGLSASCPSAVFGTHHNRERHGDSLQLTRIADGSQFRGRGG